VESTSPPGVEAGIAASPTGNAITISAPGAVVSLRGLTLEGGGTGAYNGIAFSSGAKLDIIDCAVRDYQVLRRVRRSRSQEATFRTTIPVSHYPVALAPSTSPLSTLS
jgi:hypothetical protein